MIPTNTFVHYTCRYIKRGRTRVNPSNHALPQNNGILGHVLGRIHGLDEVEGTTDVVVLNPGTHVLVVREPRETRPTLPATGCFSSVTFQFLRTEHI